MRLLAVLLGVLGSRQAPQTKVVIIGSPINVVAGGTTTLLTTPVGLRFRVTSFAMEIKTASAVVSTFTASLGVTASTYLDLCPATAATSNTVGALTLIPMVTSPAIVPASTAIVCNVSVAAVATAMTATPHLEGYYLP
jgi:hypothetical protein